MPTGSPFWLGDRSRASPSSLAACGPSVATTTFFARTRSPFSSSTTTSPVAPSSLTLRTAVFSMMASFGRPAASCSATAPIPPDGRQLLPVASIRSTKFSSLLVVDRSLRKKMPPRNGLKNLSMMAGLKPSL